jgi:glycosyltransferase involved in cell wall biosynthesis
MLKDILTIVIPCKNEGINIYDCVGLICMQKNIASTRIIIADNSDEEESMWWLWRTEMDFKYSVNIEIIKGGYPAKARLEGSKLVTTPYILFLDADIMLKERDLLEKIAQESKDLITVPKAYWECGGYKPEELFAEDYSVSHLVDSKKFKIHKTEGVYTSARRFKNKGVFYMFWLMIKCYINRNNPEFFKQHHNYWS